MSKRILFISYDGMTDPLGQSQVIPYLAGLTKHGYEFTILSCDKPERYKLNEQRIRQSLSELPIEWVSIPYHKNPPVLSSVYDVRGLKKTAALLHKKTPFDMVHTRPGVPTIVALWLKRKFGIRFLNDIRGFWADERVDGGMWNLRNPLFKRVYRYFKKHESECLEAADHNTCLTHVAKNEMLGWKVNNQPLDIKVIPCSADLELFKKESVDMAKREIFRKDLKIEADDFIISYLGSIGGWYLTEEMLRFCKMASDKIPNAKFLFISPHRHDEIIKAASKYGIPTEKIIVKNAQRNEVPVLLSFSNYSLFFIKPCYSKLSSSPTKHGEIMAMGIPVITNSGVGDVKEIVEKYDAGFVLDDFNESTFENVLAAMQTKKIDHERIRQGAIEFYSLDNAVESYASVYKKIFNS